MRLFACNQQLLASYGFVLVQQRSSHKVDLKYFLGCTTMDTCATAGCKSCVHDNKL